jgi:hypothetical protein
MEQLANIIGWETLKTIAGLVGVLVFVVFNALILTWAERKVAGHMQRRIGPKEVGPYGLIQPIADAIKLLGKEILTPREVDRPLYYLAPIIIFVPVLVSFIVIPFDASLQVKDINVGILPYNVAIGPKGDIALVANSGVTGGNDGNADTISVIDLTARPPHVIDNVNVGDGPEGLAISPDGKLAAAVLIRGSQNARANPATAWAARKNGSVAILAIDGKCVRKTGEIEVGGMPEGVVFSPDSRYIYIGKFLSRNVSILKAGGREAVDTGKTLRLPGQPGAMRGSR